VNISVYAFYAVSLLMLSRIYSAYRVGLLHVGDLFYGQVLSNLISLGLTYLLACALARRLINPLAGFGCAAVQALLSARADDLSQPACTFPCTTQAHGGDLPGRERPAQAGEIRFFAERWSVERTVQWDEENVHDLPYKKETPGGRSFEAIQKLMRIMEDYEAVFVSGVSATLRNGIVKYCVEKNKACYFVPHTGDVIISGAEHILSFSDAHLPGEAQQARTGVPAGQAGDGHPAVAVGNYCDQSIHGNRGAGDLELRPRAGAVQAGAVDERWPVVRDTKIAQHDRGCGEGRRPPGRRARRSDHAYRTDHPYDSLR
jgi:hypothetical protein